MKLIADCNCNVDLVKMLSAAQFYSVKVELVRQSDATRQSIPSLETDNGSKFISANAACRYLQNINNGPVRLKTDSWLQWELAVLKPAISKFLKKKPEEEAPMCFKHSLLYLNAVLSQQQNISGENKIDLGDIAIWADLYPLFKASLLTNVADFPAVQEWLNVLSKLDPLNQAFSSISGGAKSDNLKKLLVCNSPLSSEETRFFMPVEIPDFEKTSEGVKEEVTKEKDFTAEEITQAYDCWLKGKSVLTIKPKVVPVLPKKGERNILITSALPYVNNVPHLGNIIGAVLSADVFARYCRSRGYNTLYICGTDEYGTATETKAISMGMTPQQICDKYHKLHADIYQWFNIAFDFFGRTTTEKQTEIAQDMFNKLNDNKLIQTDTVEQLYCKSCERFLADRFVEGTCPLCLYVDARGDQCDGCGKLINAAELKCPKCKLCKKTPLLRSSKHLFLDLPLLEESLKTFLDKSTGEGCWSNTAKVIAHSWLKEGLKPRCITRDLKWGTPVPLQGFTDKVFYVWYDAPIGYLSITANYTDRWEEWWKQPENVQLYQFMAKDNVPFHSIIFPACQLGTKDKYTIVNHLAATEYLNYEETKFSKSRGTGVFGDDAKNTGLPSDVFRFYLLYVRPEAQDTDFSWSDLMLKINSELLNNLGNFINRGLSFVSNSFGGIIPEMFLSDGDKKLVAQVDCELKSYIQCMEKTKLRDAIKHLLNISRMGNQYIQANKPWVMVKGSESEKKLAGTVLGLSANICCLLCTLMEPYMPDTCEILKSQLSTESIHHVLSDTFVCLLPAGHQIGKPAPLFKKIEQSQIDELRKKHCGQQSPAKDVTAPPDEGTTEKAAQNGVGVADIEGLDASIAIQGGKVRDLKTSKASKAEIDKEVALLLDLKKQLLIAKGENVDQLQSKPKNKKKR